MVTYIGLGYTTASTIAQIVIQWTGWITHVRLKIMTFLSKYMTKIWRNNYVKFYEQDFQHYIVYIEHIWFNQFITKKKKICKVRPVNLWYYYTSKSILFKLLMLRKYIHCNLLTAAFDWMKGFLLPGQLNSSSHPGQSQPAAHRK